MPIRSNSTNCTPSLYCVAHFLIVLFALPVSNEKYLDLVELSKFCTNVAAANYFSKSNHKNDAKIRKEKKKQVTRREENAKETLVKKLSE